MLWSNVSLATLLLVTGTLIFGTLGRLFPCNRTQPSYFTKELAQNALYCLMSLVFFAGFSGEILKLGVDAVFGPRGPAVLAAIDAGYGWTHAVPVAVQVLMVLAAFDIIQYWVHRAFHGRALWPFHAIHHSATEVDWSTGFRFHPVNLVIYSAAVAAVVRLMGFSPMVYAIIAPFNLLMSGLVHANLNWTFGPFRYVIASPVFHRWHHAKDPAVRDKNFAPTFPVLDLMFGTFYMPRGVLPSVYGADEVPPHFFGQLIHPFAVYAERLGLKARPGQATA